MKSEERRSEIDRVMDLFNGLLTQGRFAECEKAMAEFSVFGVDTSVIYSARSITRLGYMHGHLPTWPEFSDRVYAEIRRQKGWFYAWRLIGRKYTPTPEEFQVELHDS